MLQWVSIANYSGENPVRTGSRVLRVLAPASLLSCASPGRPDSPAGRRGAALPRHRVSAPAILPGQGVFVLLFISRKSS